MIDLEKISKKIKPLNDQIININKRFGKEMTEELLKRIEITLGDFFNDFKDMSSKSFSIYWNNQKKIKTEKEENNKNKDISDENIPKFISDYKDDNQKK